MATIRINKFGGMQPSVDSRLLPNYAAQIADGCHLTDGSLRPLPMWQIMSTGSMSVGPARGGMPYASFSNKCGIGFSGAPFGLIDIGISYFEGKLTPQVYFTLNGSVSISPAGLSKKPINRVYGATEIVDVGGVPYESPLKILSGSDPNKVMYEGDLATISVNVNRGNRARIYRSTSDVTTGTGANGALTANWQLVHELPAGVSSYVDGGAADNPFDTYLYRGSYSPWVNNPISMGLFESGFVWLLSKVGAIAISERNAWAVWPAEGTYTIGHDSGVEVTSARSVGDVLYIGTNRGVYRAVLSVSESGQGVLAITPLDNSPACLPYSMAPTPSGVVYASTRGIVGVTGGSASMVSKGINSVAPVPDGTEVPLVDIIGGVYHYGVYYAWTKTACLLFPIGDQLAPVGGLGGVSTVTNLDDNQWSLIAEYMSPRNADISYVSSSVGLVVASGQPGDGDTGPDMTLALPEDTGSLRYAGAPKLRYTWKSKKFVFPSQTTMSAGLVRHDCGGGGVQLRLYVDCCCVWQTVVRGCVPFRLPDQLRGHTWEVELLGCSRVTEVVIASSIRELMANG